MDSAAKRDITLREHADELERRITEAEEFARMMMGRVEKLEFQVHRRTSDEVPREPPGKF